MIGNTRLIFYFTGLITLNVKDLLSNLKTKTKSNKEDWLFQALVGNYSILAVSGGENLKENVRRSKQSKPESLKYA